MNTWKFSIKPDSKPGFNAFKKCKELNIVGIGWSEAYKNEQPKDYEHAKILLLKQWPKGIAPEINKLFVEIQPGDHLWLHKDGIYYLCVPGRKKLIAREICDDFISFDLGHARDAKWLRVSDELISGSIQRGVIAQRMIQQINISDVELKVNKYIETNLSSNPQWFPIVDLKAGVESIDQISENEFWSILTPDDVEDIIAAKLQTDGWILIKSTCFRSKPKFEFSMINRQGQFGLIQVKSGNQPDSLAPSDYQQYLKKDNHIFLFSTRRDPYPGRQFDGIHCFSKKEIHQWVKDNPQLLSYPLKLKFTLAIGG
jgi:hypothetical protein